MSTLKITLVCLGAFCSAVVGCLVVLAALKLWETVGRVDQIWAIELQRAAAMQQQQAVQPPPGGGK